MILTLIRKTPSSRFGTFGALFSEDGTGICVTLELPWQNNQHDVSCVPAGTYQCLRVQSAEQLQATPENGDRFELQNVPNRNSVEIHAGNTIKDSKGCILVGTQYGAFYDGTPCILQARDEFKSFMNRMKGVNAFTLVIKEA